MYLGVVLLLLVCTTMTQFGVQCILRLPNSYSNHMVLQRAPQRAILWGYADVIGDTVMIFKNGVHVQETSVEQKANNVTQGFWKVALPAESNAGPFEILVTSSEGTVSLSDVMFGDVWICSGQSNMQFRMRDVINSSQEISDSLNYGNIRMIYSAPVKSAVPLDDVAINHPWTYPVKGIIDHFSALCFLFARDLHEHLNYPIGLIESNWGGTRIQVWSSTAAIETCPSTRTFRPSRWGNSDLWNSMIHPYLQMTIKGVIWYQGEGNRGHPDLYACQFPAMINDWRKQFHAASGGETSEQFPFGFVQLAPYRYGNIIGGFPPTRWAQTTNVGFVPNENMPNTFMAVAIDLPGVHSRIHPRNKQDIAARLVLGARNIAYGDHSVAFQGPFPTNYHMNAGQQNLVITFDNGNSHLQVNNNNGFEICCVSKTDDCSNQSSWVVAGITGHHASAVEIDVSSCHGYYHVGGVRYMWRETPCPLKYCALYDSHTQLPVPPFIKTERCSVSCSVVK